MSAPRAGPGTVQKAYQLLGTVMGAAVDAGMIPQTPCRRVPLPKVDREEMWFLTPAEVATLADAIAPRYRALVLVGAYGGLRIGELARLRPWVGGLELQVTSARAVTRDLLWTARLSRPMLSRATHAPKPDRPTVRLDLRPRRPGAGARQVHRARAAACACGVAVRDRVAVSRLKGAARGR